MLCRVIPASRQQVVNRVQLVDRHDRVPQFVVRRMQRYGKRDIAVVRELVDVRHNARGTDRDPAARQPIAPVRNQQPQDGNDVAVIRQRLPHSHENDIGNGRLAIFATRQLAIGDEHLADDFRARQVAVESLRAGCAKRAVERAPDL